MRNMSAVRSFTVLLLAAATLFTASCGRQSAAPSGPANDASIGVLIVAHGSKSSTWVNMVKTLADQVREPILKAGAQEVRLAFIQETKPDVASEMRAFDAAGIKEVVVVPLLIAGESTITNDYLQYLTGMRTQAKAIKQLQNEGFDLYYPRARVTMTPALSDSDVLKKNVLRRVNELKGEGSGENMAVVLVGYGDKVYGQQASEIMEGIGRFLKIKTDIDTVAYAFCGKLTDYSGEPVVKVINEVLELEPQVLVVPVLVGVDEMLQINTIQAAINAVGTSSKVRYKPDAVLPDPVVNEWVVGKVTEAVQRVRDAGGATVPAPNRG